MWKSFSSFCGSMVWDEAIHYRISLFLGSTQYFTHSLVIQTVLFQLSHSKPLSKRGYECKWSVTFNSWQSDLKL